MRQETMVRNRLEPWDDRAFVLAFEAARRAAVREGYVINGPRAACRVEELLHAAGYVRATVESERTVDDALRRIAIWTVRRDGVTMGVTDS